MSRLEMEIHIEAPKPSPAKPPVYVVLPVIPGRRVPTEAHLYISPAETVAQGQHSIVYKAEWEIPRNVLVDEYMCTTCTIEDAMNILAEKDGKNGERRDPKWDVLSGAFIPDKELTEDDRNHVSWAIPPHRKSRQIPGPRSGPLLHTHAEDDGGDPPVDGQGLCRR